MYLLFCTRLAVFFPDVTFIDTDKHSSHTCSALVLCLAAVYLDITFIETDKHS